MSDRLEKIARLPGSPCHLHDPFRMMKRFRPRDRQRVRRGMEILGIGTEIIECPRIGKMIEQHGEIFLRRVYTSREIRFCQARKHAIEQFASHWAAKEAILKAMGTAWSPKIQWTDLEVRISPTGSPKVHIAGNAKQAAMHHGIIDILLTIAHCRTYATAYAVALGAGSSKHGGDELDLI